LGAAQNNSNQILENGESQDGPSQEESQKELDENNVDDLLKNS